MGKRIKGMYIMPSPSGSDVEYIIGSVYSETMLEQLYEKLHCSTVELIYRRVCGIDIEIWCDEEGKLKDDAQVVGTGFYGNGMVAEILVGPIFICATSPKGASMSLTEEEIDAIIHHLQMTYEFEYEMR